MLVGSDFKRADGGLPFHDALVGFFCGNENKASVTKVFTLYYDLNYTLRNEITLLFWTGEELLCLAKMIHEFKVAAT